MKWRWPWRRDQDDREDRLEDLEQKMQQVERDWVKVRKAKDQLADWVEGALRNDEG